MSGCEQIVRRTNRSDQTETRSNGNHCGLHCKQCKRCARWVDDTCWNPQRGLCLECAPDLEAEYSAAQTEAAVQQARQVAQEATYVTKEKFDKTVVGACLNCGASIAANAKFCGECGQPIKREKFCTECGAKMEGSPKFCPDYGAKQS